MRKDKTRDIGLTVSPITFVLTMKKGLLIAFCIAVLYGCQNKTKVMNKATVVERVSFQLNEGYSVEQGKEAMTGLNDYLIKQKGFVSRTTTVSEDGIFLDLVYWEDLESAKNAAEKIMKEPKNAQSFEVINQGTMQFGHFEIFNKQ